MLSVEMCTLQWASSRRTASVDCATLTSFAKSCILTSFRLLTHWNLNSHSHACALHHTEGAERIDLFVVIPSFSCGRRKERPTIHRSPSVTEHNGGCCQRQCGTPFQLCGHSPQANCGITLRGWTLHKPYRHEPRDFVSCFL